MWKRLVVSSWGVIVATTDPSHGHMSMGAQSTPRASSSSSVSQPARSRNTKYSISRAAADRRRVWSGGSEERETSRGVSGSVCPCSFLSSPRSAREEYSWYFQGGEGRMTMPTRRVSAWGFVLFRRLSGCEGCRALATGEGRA